MWLDGLPDISAGKESAYNIGDPGDEGLILGSGRSPEGRNGKSLLNSCLGNPMDRRAWQAKIHVVAKSQTGLSD